MEMYMTEQEAQNLKDKYISRKIFVRIPSWIIYGRGLDTLKGAELKVLVYVCSRMNNQTDSTSVTREEISRATGVSLGSISGIIHSLLMQCFIRVEKDGRNNTYYVQFVPPYSWPLHSPTNAARIHAAAGRREVLHRNCSQYQSNSAPDSTIPPTPSDQVA